MLSKKARAELNVFELPKEKTEKFDNFLVANAFAQKDKQNLWIYFRQAMNRSGDGGARRGAVLENQRYDFEKKPR